MANVVGKRFQITIDKMVRDKLGVRPGKVSNLVAVDGDTYTFTITARDAGSVTVSVPAAKAVDGASNPNAASNALAWTYLGG